MNDYVADNGVVLTGTDDDSIRWHPGISQRRASEALREFFQAERDEELGRWRDPENPDMVAYRTPEDDDESGRCILLLDENTGDNHWEWEHTALPGPADRYFTAHPLPEPEPKPWLEAKPGEVWALTYAGIEETAWVADFTWGAPPRFRQFKNLLNPIFTNDDSITAGRRIWPEGDDNDE